MKGWSSDRLSNPVHPTNSGPPSEEQDEWASFQQSIAELSMYALEETNLLNIIEKTTRYIIKHFKADYCLLFGWNKETDTLKLLSSNVELPDNQLNNLPVSRIWDIGYVFHTSATLYTPDYRKALKYRLIPNLQKLKIRSGLLKSFDSPPNNEGVLCLYTLAPRKFTQTEIEQLQSFSRILKASINRSNAVLKNYQLNQKLDNEIKNNRRFQREILNNSIVERWKLGEYLHDNFAQTLASIKITIHELKKEEFQTNPRHVAHELETIIRLIDKQIKDIRNLSHEIIPIDVEEDGASHAFRLLLKQIQRTHKVNCKLVADDIINKINCRELSTNLYHITQEAITNAINHGKAKNIQVIIKAENSHMLLKIEDDGTGFTEQDKKNGGMGLRIIKHRVELFGGTFTIDTQPEDATCTTSIVCRFPLDATVGLKRE